MSSPHKLELKTAGQSALLLVSSCGLAKVGKYPEVEFIGTTDKNQFALIAVNQKSAERQLQRIGLTMETAVGEVLRFGRSASSDPAKPFWDIELVSGSTAPATNAEYLANEGAVTTQVPDPAPPADDAPHPADRQSERANGNGHKSGAALYVELTKFALKNVIPLYVEAKIPVSHEATAAMVATLYIEANRRS